MDAYRGSTGIAPLILNLSTGERWVVIMPWPLCPQKKNSGAHWNMQTAKIKLH